MEEPEYGTIHGKRVALTKDFLDNMTDYERSKLVVDGVRPGRFSSDGSQLDPLGPLGI